jgi:glycosyltransferase involved in cell wall biosynthesis
MLDICVVSHNAWGAIAGGRTGHVGGVEHQTSLLCKWLAGQGHRVSILTWDEGQENDLILNGVKVMKICKKNDGVAGVRFLYPRWTSLNRAMRMANAAIYYQNCGEYVTGQVALWCKMQKKYFVYSVACDPDCDVRLPGMETIRERVLYRYGLRHAKRIIVQTRKQQKMLRDGFGLDSVSLPMPCPGPTEKEYVKPVHCPSGKLRVLWVGRICRVKRLDVLLEVAEILPAVSFEIAGAPDDESEYIEPIVAKASQLPNVVFHGRVERERMGELYQKASLLCCTSLCEGFPNTFLEAWSHGLPIVSSVDPDGLISTHNMGIFADGISNFVSSINTLMNSPGRWEIMSQNARRYYQKNHSVEGAMKQFENIFIEVLNGKRGGSLRP